MRATSTTSASNLASTFNPSSAASSISSTSSTSNTSSTTATAFSAAKGRPPRQDENAIHASVVRKRPSLTFTRTTTTVNRTRRPHSPHRTTAPSPLSKASPPPRQQQQQQQPPFPQRIPLSTRDHNVTVQRAQNTNMRNLAAPRSTKDSSVGRMPVDKSSHHHNNNNNNNNAPSRHTPQMPTLAKGIARAPITPKVASRQTVTLATPLPRRAPRPESALSNGPTIATAAALTPNNVSQRDDLATPVSTLANSNVTPRSGSRQTRVDSANSTPTGTPNLSRADSWDTRPGLGISTAGGVGEALRRPAVTFSPPPSDWRQEQQNSADSKFFYASDAKPTQQATLPKNPIAQTKTPTFFYANGENIPNRAPQSPSVHTPTLGTPSTDSFSSKFVYANGPPDLQPTVKAAGPGSVASVGSRLSGGRPGTGTQSPGSTSQRPASPVKMPSYPTSKSSAASIVGGTRSALASAPQLAPANPALRRMSVETPSRVGNHSRAGSLNNAEHTAGTRIPSNSSSDISSPSVLNNQALTMASILQAAEDFAEHDDGSPDTLASPTKSTHGNDPLNELVASARRERKVQDLEITNASLEAINRTLERQLRKQTAELRRYRRLSRSGRLSLNSLGSVRSRIPSDSSIGEGPLAMDSLDLSDLSEEESEPEDDDMDESDSEDSDSGGSARLSPNAVAARDARHRKRDEKRLRLDLSKHQELLVDSQKINQSLKRCLGLTEELIKDGKRALEYQVRVSEVEIGGRVLAPADEEEESSTDGDTPVEDESAPTDDDDTQRIRLDEPSGSNLDVWSKDPQDRDSGIELPRDGG